MASHLHVTRNERLFHLANKWFTTAPLFLSPTLFFIDAQFGRFAPKDKGSIFMLDGIKTWIAMEIVSPIAFLYAFTHSPLSVENYGSAPDLSLSNPAAILAGLYLIHYVNRALVSPLRSPSRSKSHISVPLSAVAFNVANGCLMGAYLSSPQATKFLLGAMSRTRFWFGIGLWAAGFVGNLVHDEILFNIRRQAKSKGKARARNSDAEDNKDQQEHYAIPYGYLYSLISYPNYFCEWMEWLGFALAAAPVPAILPIANYSPPWGFVFSEVLLMLPRAYRGHKWYHAKFPDYPKDRKAAIPFVL